MVQALHHIVTAIVEDRGQLILTFSFIGQEPSFQALCNVRGPRWAAQKVPLLVAT